MQQSLENPFRDSAKRAKKRLFKDEGLNINDSTNITKERVAKKMEQTKVKYGSHEILYPQWQFLKELEKLILEQNKNITNPGKLLDKNIWTDDDGNIIRIRIYKLKLAKLPDLPLPPALQYFECSTNKLENLPELPATLRSLRCFQNNLTSLPDLPASLVELECGWNHLTETEKLKISNHKNSKRGKGFHY